MTQASFVSGNRRASDIDPSLAGRPVDRARRRERPPPTGWRLVALMGSLSIFGPLCIDMYLPALPEIDRQLHSSASAVQVTLTACMLGISVGQLVIGPMSDRLGRRAPLLAGLAIFVMSSVACAAAPNIYFLWVFRVLQGFGGAAGMVISRSIVRDLVSGLTLVRFFSTMMLATGLGPLLAPQIGSGVLSFTSWRGVFLVLAGFGAVLLWSAWLRIPETLPVDRRVAGGVRNTLGIMRKFAGDRQFVGCSLALSLGMGGIFSYIAGSSFVLQNVYGVSPRIFSLLFALNAVGLVIGSQLNGHLAQRHASSRLLNVGLVIMISGSAVFLVLVLSRSGGLLAVMPCLFAAMFGVGFVGPNAQAIALQRYPETAGSAAAVLGSVQFVMAATVAPLAGAGGSSDALPMALLLVSMPAAALVVRSALGIGTGTAALAVSTESA